MNIDLDSSKIASAVEAAMKTPSKIIELPAIIENCSADDDSDKSFNRLQICLPSEQQQFTERATKKTPAKQKSVKKRPKKRLPIATSMSTSSDDESKIDHLTEEQLQQSAKRNNLTDDIVKKIIRKVVGNDHVLAICKLKEEEIEKERNNEQDCVHPIKLTRAKAKVLNKNPFPLTQSLQVSDVVPPFEAATLINDELRSDDEDEEYQPGDDEIHSDDDINTTISDIESQPRTPLTPWQPPEDEGTPKYTTDGLFKIPKTRTDSCNSLPEQDYVIAHKTRSKINLATTTIELLESTFHPPDIPPDFYDMDLDTERDTDWFEFIDTLTKDQEIVDDDEADPEYSIETDEVIPDREELRGGRVSKKELNDLYEELLSILPDDDLDELKKMDNIPENLPRSNSRTRKSKNDSNNSETQQPLPLPQQQPQNQQQAPQQQIPQFPQQPLYQPDQQTQLYNQQLNTSDSILFQPNQISTPIQQNAIKRSYPQGQGGSLKINENIYKHKQQPIQVIAAPVISQPTIIIAGNVANSTPSTLQLPVDQLDAYQGALEKDGVIELPPFQQVLVQVPTMDILKLQSKPAIQQHDGYRMKRYQGSLYSHLNDEEPMDITFDDNATGFTPQQRSLLDQQLRIHVQFATQNFLQVYGHPGNSYWVHANTFKKFLTDLDKIPIDVTNLKGAIELIEQWEADLSKPTEENTKYLEYLESETSKAKLRMTQNSSHISKFHERLMDKVVHSNVFIYPKYLPKIPYRLDIKSKISTFCFFEDDIIASGLEKYFTECQKEQEKYQTKKEIPLKKICARIGQHICTFRDASSIYNYVMRRKNKSCQMNPIKYYFQHNKAPLTKHKIESIDLANILAPIDQPFGDLPYLWAKYVERLKAIEHDKLVNPSSYTAEPAKKAPPTQSVAPNVRSTATKSTVRRNLSDALATSDPNEPIIFSENNDEFVIENVQSDGRVSQPIQFIVKYTADDPLRESVVSNEIPVTSIVKCQSPISICSYDYSRSDDDETNVAAEETAKRIDASDQSTNGKELSKGDRIEPGQTLLTSYFSSFIPSPTKRSSSITKTLLNKYQNRTTNPINTLAKITLRKYKNRRPLTKFLRLKVKLFHILNRFKNEQIRLEQSQLSEKLQRVFRHLKTLDIYLSLSIDLKLKMSCSGTTKRPPKLSNGDDECNKKTKSNDESAAQICSEMLPADQPTIESATLQTKRGQKAHRTMDNTKLMLLPEEDTNEKDYLFAQNFMDKVEEVYLAENKPEKIDEFETILRNFNPTSKKVPDLYYQIEKLFLPDHPELVEMFLAFLLPGQAAQVGKFMEHFMLTNMATFINKLNIFFTKQPAQIRKIMTCLKELSLEEDLKMDQIKLKVLPLLKGNPLLIDWFQNCFATERPTESSGENSEYERLNFHKAAENVDDIDVYEQIPQTDILPDPIDNPCHIRYMNGRIYYGNRILLPAKLSFLVVTAEDQQQINSNKNVSKAIVPSQLECDVDDGSGSGRYRCVHAIKQFGDAKLREHQKHHFESDANDLSAEVPDEIRSEHAIKIEDRNSSFDSNSDTSNICDDIMLKAHGIRLNPTAHATELIKSEDLLSLIEPSTAQMNRSTDSDRSESPKKQYTKGVRKLSPNQKKIPSTKRSPIAKKSTAAYALPTEDSPAIQSAKKLKNLCQTNDSSTTNKLSKPNQVKSLSQFSLKITKRKKRRKFSKSHKRICTKLANERTAAEDTSSSSCSDDRSGSSSSDEQTAKMEMLSPPSTPPPSSAATSLSSNDWSRNEDRLILEKLKLGFTSEEDVVNQLTSNELSTRNYAEVSGRIKFLMDIIANL